MVTYSPALSLSLSLHRDDLDAWEQSCSFSLIRDDVGRISLSLPPSLHRDDAVRTGARSLTVVLSVSVSG